MNGSKSSKDSTSEKNDSGMTVTEETTQTSFSGSDGPSTWVLKPEGATVIDDAFWVKKQRWGTFVSVDEGGKEIITSLTEDLCVESTRWYLKQKQEGFQKSLISYEGVVGGKL